MANDEDLARLRQGVAVWNAWRAQNRERPVDLSGAQLREANLEEAYLVAADLQRAYLVAADLQRAYLVSADLAAAHLDHDPANNRLRNLRSLCQRCHLTHDRPHHLAARRITYLLRRASGDLFVGPYVRRRPEHS